MLITPSHRASSSVKDPKSGLGFSASSSCSAKVVMLSSVLFWVVLSPPPQPSSAFSVVVAELAVSPPLEVNWVKPDLTGQCLEIACILLQSGSCFVKVVMLITPSHRASSSVKDPKSGLGFSASSSCSAKVVMLSSVLFWVVLSPPPQPSSAFSVVVAELAVSPPRQSSNFFFFVLHLVINLSRLNSSPELAVSESLTAVARLTLARKLLSHRESLPSWSLSPSSHPSRLFRFHALLSSSAQPVAVVTGFGSRRESS
ncbi:hypothetical protein Bca52824_033073 [Brassica carinata]|uniref:Uncharacterized protein n=1 Tax=Brassica carinata TaxID=52824 RepID=A0A8X7SEA9_BRACI|nr:hypothetical protein Bca52824_033073 [Brassica carinata]